MKHARLHGAGRGAHGLPEVPIEALAIFRIVGFLCFAASNLSFTLGFEFRFAGRFALLFQGLNLVFGDFLRNAHLRRAASE
jgi:hypothetical protein